MNKMLIAYLVAGGGMVGLYALGELTWWEKAPVAISKITPSVRKSTGGWRVYPIWYRGLRTVERNA